MVQFLTLLLPILFVQVVWSSSIGSILDVCNDPKGETGQCRARMPMYTYNKETDNCEEFIYGGCQGNMNQFDTLEECLLTCQRNPVLPPKDVKVCDEPRTTTGACRASMNSYTYNKQTNKCEQFVFGGCDETENYFEDQNQCERTCVKTGDEHLTDPKGVCGQVKGVVGSCEVAQKEQTKYTFDWQTKRCDSFEYSGCGGNDNRFETFLECEKTCGAVGSA